MKYLWLLGRLAPQRGIGQDGTICASTTTAQCARLDFPPAIIAGPDGTELRILRLTHLCSPAYAPACGAARCHERCGHVMRPLAGALPPRRSGNPRSRGALTLGVPSVGASAGVYPGPGGMRS